MSGPYAGRRIALASCHGKERALARPLAAGLGLVLEVPEIDTDQLGTFCGEVERPSDALETCRRKAMLGLEATGLALGLASEASFGPHPGVPMVAVGHELLLFIDRERQLTVAEQRLDWRTNYSRLHIGANDDPNPWLKQVGFPSHAVIVRPQWGHLVVKGVNGKQRLQEAIDQCRHEDPGGQVLLETDMRAHLNPTRMASIRRLGFDLVRRLRRRCPACGTPGWGLVETLPGLPCSDCGAATRLTKLELWGCPSCDEQRQQARPDGLLEADPGCCDWCNP